MAAKAEPDRGQVRCYLIILAGSVPITWLLPCAAGWHLPSVEVEVLEHPGAL